MSMIFMALLVLTSLYSVPVDPSSIQDFDGESQIELRFDQAGNHTFNITIPGPFISGGGSINITGAPYSDGGNTYPADVVMDLGDDGAPEMTFTGKGFGPFGYQDRFNDDDTIKEFSVQDHTYQGYGVLLPVVSFPQEAGLTLTGIPTPTSTIALDRSNLTVPSSGRSDHVTGGIDSGQLTRTANATLSDVVKIIQGTPVDQDAHNNMQYMDIGEYSAQSFAVNSTDPKQEVVKVHSIEIYVGHVGPTDQGLELRIFNASVGSDYIPIGPVISNKTVWMPDIPDGGYVNFTFDPPVALEPDKIYVMVLREMYLMAMSGHFNVAYHQGPSSFNFNSNYPVEGSWWMFTTDNGQNWVPSKGRDMRFRTHVDKAVPLVPVEYQDIEVDGKKADLILGDDLWYNITSPRYDDLGWNLSIDNGLQSEILLDLSARLDHYDVPTDITIDVDDDQVIDYSYPGDLEGHVDITGLEDEIYDFLEMIRDNNNWGNYSNSETMQKIPFDIHANGNGTIRIENLFVRYHKTLFVNIINGLRDLFGNLNDIRDGLTIPVKVSSSSPGTIILSDLRLNYDSPPGLVGPIPDNLTVPEEGLIQKLLDLNDLIKDDYYPEPNFSIVNVTTEGEGNSTVDVSIFDGRYLSVDATSAINWTGMVQVHVNATDKRLGSTIGPMNVTIEDVNDPPVIVSRPPRYALVGQVYEYQIVAEDSDDEDLTCGAEGLAEGMELSEGDMVLRWTPLAAQVGNVSLHISVYDGEYRVHQFENITVRSPVAPNEPPLIQPIPDRTIIIGDEFIGTIIALDPDGDVLTYELLDGPEGMELRTGEVLHWIPDAVGDFEVKIGVFDGLEWSNVTFNITVQDKGTIILTIEHPTKDQVIRRDLIIRGNATISGSAVEKVEYMIDDGKWYQAIITVDGQWSAFPDVSNMKKGSHTIVVRATDSGETKQTYTTFMLKKRSSTGSTSALASLESVSYLLLAVIVIAIIVAAVAISKRRSRPKKDGPNGGAKVKEKDPKGDVDSAFLVYHDGRLITYSARGKIEDLDGTLQVIKNFVKASFKGEVGKLDSLRYENMNVIIERGIQMYLVVLTPKDDVKTLRREMRRFLHDVNSKHRHVLKVWDGRYKTVKGVALMVEAFVSGDRGDTDDEDETQDDEEDDGKEEKSTRWDDSPDIDSKDLSKVEKQKDLEDKLLRGEITEQEFDGLTKKLT